MRSNSLKLGDIIEINADDILGYGQYFARHPEIQSVSGVRVFETRFKSRPVHLEELVTQPLQFIAWLPLAAVVARGGLAVVGNASIPPGADLIPLMKRTRLRPDGSVRGRAIVDLCQNSSRNVGFYSAEELTLSEMQINTNEGAIRQRFASGWRPEHVETYGYRHGPLGLSKARTDAVALPEEPRRSHYLYVASQAAANEARGRIEAMGLAVVTERTTDSAEWLVVVAEGDGGFPTIAPDLAAALGEIAEGLGGRYDGDLRKI